MVLVAVPIGHLNREGWWRLLHKAGWLRGIELSHIRDLLKYEWYDQIEKLKGEPPTAGEINEWISQIAAIRIKTWRAKAARAFDVAAQAYTKNQIAEARRDAINDRIVTAVESNLNEYKEEFLQCLAEVRTFSSLRNQILVGLIAAILSPIILGLMIRSIQAADLWPTPTGFADLFHHRPAEVPPKPQPTHNP